MGSENKVSLGNLISKRRHYLRLTQEELAERMNVSKSAIAKWETDGGIPDRGNLLKLAEVMDVSINDLYRIIDDKNAHVNSGVNITGDVIASLESYGYIVIAPNEKNEEDLK